jgi:hypothetical protein
MFGTCPLRATHKLKKLNGSIDTRTFFNSDNYVLKNSNVVSSDELEISKTLIIGATFTTSTTWVVLVCCK